MQYQLTLIPHEVDDSIVLQRASDGFINATEMCIAAGKDFHDYRRLKSTRAFLDELESDTGIPGSQLIVSLKGNSNKFEQGTWVHPDIAINLGQWCSARFAVAVSRWVRDWHSRRDPMASLPYHLRRYMTNADKIPDTHFSMLSELTIHLIGKLEAHGYRLPEAMVPDISEGRMFSKWLRDEKGIEPSGFPSYDHEFEDGRVVSARLYPMHLYQDFRKHFSEIWIPKRMLAYFKERDPNALGYFPRAFPKLFPGATNGVPRLAEPQKRFRA